MPSTNSQTWPRYFCVSAGMMELFALGYSKGRDGETWGFINVAADIVNEQFGSVKGLRRSFPKIKIHKATYRDGGQHQLSLSCINYTDLAEILGDQRILNAAGHLAMRVMRKRATIYSKFHCKQLADHALAME